MCHFEQTTDYEDVNPNLPKMASKILSLFALFAIATMTIPFAHASNPSQISLTSYGNTEIDLAGDERDQMISSWTSVSNFDPKDKSISMKIVQSETGKIVAESSIGIVTNMQRSSIDFNTFVRYQVNAEDICQNEEFDSNSISLQECNPLTGQYEMQVSTNDGSVVGSSTFTIVDTRA